jgi:hypothetical protein
MGIPSVAIQGGSMRKSIPVVLAAALVLAACGGSDDDGGSAPADSSPTTESESESATGMADGPAGTATATSEADATATTDAVVQPAPQADAESPVNEATIADDLNVALERATARLNEAVQYWELRDRPVYSTGSATEGIPACPIELTPSLAQYQAVRDPFDAYFVAEEAFNEQFIQCGPGNTFSLAFATGTGDPASWQSPAIPSEQSGGRNLLDVFADVLESTNVPTDVGVVQVDFSPRGADGTLYARALWSSGMGHAVTLAIEGKDIFPEDVAILLSTDLRPILESVATMSFLIEGD